MTEQSFSKKKKKSKSANMATAGEPEPGGQLQDGVSVKPEQDEQLENGVKIEPEPAVDAQKVTKSSLGDLQNKDSRQVMDIVDRLSRSGLSGELQLPQLVVCGDQSSGKSSVLEAITEIPFPRKENLCTRFATELVLRRATTASIRIKIIPDEFRPATEKKRLEGFKPSIVDFSELPTLIEEATQRMSAGEENTGTTKAFFRDVLSIEIAGPGRPHLTVVDLPGLIHAETKWQSKADVELIRDLVQDYFEEKRTIILAVVSAKNDYANQIILKKCREVDPKGHRTLGIITKPDFLEPGSDGEQAFIDLAKNYDVVLALGWHMLKNRSEKELGASFNERNSAEATFFSRGRYRDLPPEMLGITSLRGRLSQLLYKHLKTELPALQQELNEKHREVSRELGLLGDKRSTPQEQRRFLMGISNKYQDIVNSAVKGHYEEDFFGTLEPEESVDHESNMRRLRAVVQYLNLQFANLMRDHGQKTEVEEDSKTAPSPDTTKESQLDEGYAQFADLQEVVSREAAIQRVSKVLIRSRGRELPCTFNPLLISQLFWKQSENWKAMAEYHIDRVAQVCSMFVRAAMGFVVSSDVADNLLTLKVDSALHNRLTSAKAELETIIKDSRRHPITYNPRYVDAVQQRRNKVYSARMEELTEEASKFTLNPVSKQGELCIDKKQLKQNIEQQANSDMNEVCAQEALDDSLAYYEEEVKYFIAVVTKQIIERYLLTDLAVDTICPLVIGEMNDDEIAFVAAEPEETTRERNSLEARKAVLEKGQQTFKSALGLFKAAAVL